MTNLNILWKFNLLQIFSILLVSAIPQHVTAATDRFRALWNCPYMGQTDFETFGITANPSGSFNGSEVTLFYGPSTWPTMRASYATGVTPCWVHDQPGCTWNLTKIWTNFTVLQNGGVPQAGNLKLHTDAVAEMVSAMIPDPNFSGYGIFDWENWRVLYSENDDGLTFNRAYSELLVRKAHPEYNESQVAAAGELAFNAGAKAFFLATLQTAQRLRPLGRFGFYEYPMAATLTQLMWLWEAVGVLLPSDYLRTAASTENSVNTSLTVAAAVQSATSSPQRRPHVAPYIRLWSNGAMTSAAQLTASIVVPAVMGADAVIIWGSSGDAHYQNYTGTITAFLQTSVGPLLKGCIADRDACAAQLCSSHGRCGTTSDAVVDATTAAAPPPWPPSTCSHAAATAVCICDAGWTGASCNQKLNV